jgi:hypothetical protein
MLYAFGSLVCAQTASGNHKVKITPAVAISIASVTDKQESGAGLRILVSITNNTKKYLVHRYAIQRSPVKIEIHGASGTAPIETEIGCKRHMSTECGPNVNLGGQLNIWALIANPGHTISFYYDIAREYTLDSSDTYTIDAVANDFVLVDAPQNVIDEPSVAARSLGLTNYEHYNYTKLDPFHSNSITVQVSH